VATSWPNWPAPRTERVTRRRVVPVVVLACIAAASPCFAVGGTVHDDRGRPIEGAVACIVLGPDALGLCAETDVRGSFRLPGDTVPALQIRADGFLTVNVAGVDHVAPIRLERAARFEVTIVDRASGSPVEGARVRILSSDGRQRGPIELGPAGRLAMKSFPAGEFLLAVEADGYVSDATTPLALVAGKTTTVTVELRRAGAPPPGD
jgi:hypothetical protein